MAARIDPEEDLAWFNKGLALRLLGRYEVAVSALDRSFELKPETGGESLVNKGEALEAIGRSVDAEASYAKARELGYES